MRVFCICPSNAGRTLPFATKVEFRASRRHAIVAMRHLETSALAMACTEDCGLSTMPRRGWGALVMSGLLHLGGAALWLSLQGPARPVDDPVQPMVVEIALEAPAAPPPTEIIQPEAKPATAPISTSRPAPRRVAASPVLPKTAPMSTATAPPPPSTAEPAASGEAASPGPSEPPRRTVSTTEYGAYVGRLHDRIAQRRVYPPQSIRRREEGDVRLRIMLATDGRLLHIHTLAESTSLLTQAARDAVESSAPFDPPPMASPSDQQMAFDVTVAFRIR